MPLPSAPAARTTATGGQVVRQSDLKLWQRCPLQYRWTYIDKIPRKQSASTIYGSIVHDCVHYLETTGNLDGAIARFKEFWGDPTQLDPTFVIDYYVRGTNWKKYWEAGPKVLRDWWGIVQWDADPVLAREHEFDVPIGDGHVLHGTADKVVLRYNAKLGRHVLVIVDYKTNAKVPTYEYLNEDLQFTAYGYASTRPEFWTGIENGDRLFAELADTPRFGEWVALTGPKRMDAGQRNQQQYNRLVYAVNALAESVAMRIFVPNISGESCRYCDWRAQCGLPQLDDNGEPLEGAA